HRGVAGEAAGVPDGVVERRVQPADPPAEPVAGHFTAGFEPSLPTHEPCRLGCEHGAAGAELQGREGGEVVEVAAHVAVTGAVLVEPVGGGGGEAPQEMVSR